MTLAVSSPRRVLLIQLRRLGDVLLSSPLLQDLRRAYPDASLDFLVGCRAAPLLEGDPFMDDRLIYDNEHPYRMWRMIRSRRYDWIIDVQSSPRTAPLVLVSGSPVRAGWNIRGWSWVYTHRLPRGGQKFSEYVVRERQRFLELLHVPIAPARPRIHLTCEEREEGERLARAFGAPAEVPRVGIVLSGADPKREWSVDGFAGVAEQVASEGAIPLLFHMPGDDAKVARFLGHTRSAIVAPLPELRRFLSVLSTCRAFVSANTGPAHMAMALDVPTVTIYVASLPEAWNPGLSTTAAVRAKRMPSSAAPDADRSRERWEPEISLTVREVAERVREFLG